MNEEIKNYLNEQSKTIDKIKEILIDDIDKIFKILIDAQKNEKTIYILGNGGSASTASHFTSDLLKTSITKNKKRIKAVSLTDNIPVITAWTNDSSYSDVFLQQLENFLEPNDVVIGISGSGNSENIIKAMEFSNKKNAITVGITGSDGGKLFNCVQTCLKIPNQNMLTIESMHLIICHLLTTLFRKIDEPMFKY